MTSTLGNLVRGLGEGGDGERCPGAVGALPFNVGLYHARRGGENE